jgi:isopenicillin-N epimerase
VSDGTPCWRNSSSIQIAALEAYVGAHEEDLVFVPNATAGVNVAAWPLDLQPADEGALDRSRIRGDSGARYVRTPIRLPVTSAEEIVDAVWAGVGPRTRALFLSHRTSTTAMTLPRGLNG